jgi:hypothetical protein
MLKQAHQSGQPALGQPIRVMSGYEIPTYADPIQAMAMRIAERLRNSVGFALLYAQAPWRRSAMQRR